MSTSRSNWRKGCEASAAIEASSEDCQRNTPRTISVVRPRSARERPSTLCVWSSSLAKAESRSTLRRISKAAARAGETGISAAEQLAVRGTVAVDEIADAHALLALDLELRQFDRGAAF